VSEAGHGDERSLLESAPHDPDDAKVLIGLRDISSLATWTLSSSKPGCALPQLRHPSPTYFWQSDGPQPHTLTLHFFKLVAIVKMRIYLDFELDESYTPTKMKFFAGMSEGGLVEFGGWEVQETTDPETGEVHSGFEGIRGWIDIPLKGVGGRDTRYHEGTESLKTTLVSRKKKSAMMADKFGVQDRPTKLEQKATGPIAGRDLETENYVGGDILKAMVVQVRICENHQNGKDTHVRGFQVYARDEGHGQDVRRRVKKDRDADTTVDENAEEPVGVVGLQSADWMMDPEIR
jgi:anaphase-promoting complex subunit 10